MALSPNLRGALFMAISMAGFTINDTFVKAASDHVNPAQIMVLRGAMASVLIFLLCWKTGALRPPRLLFSKAVGGRSLGEMLATVTWLIGLPHMKLANASAILQALPLAVTLGAAILLGEPVGWRRWLAIAVGFVGVMVIVQPGADGFNIWSLMIVACVAFAAFRDLVTRSAPAEIPSAFMSLATSLLITLTGLLLLLPMGGWTPMQPQVFFWLAGAAFFLLFGYQFVIQAMRSGEIGFVAPFRYTSLLWAIALGFLVFQNMPDLPMAIGAVMIVASGIYTFHRERIRARTIAAEGTNP